MLDRFGKDIPVLRINTEGWSQTIVDVAFSDPFLGWIFSLGNRVKIVGPGEAVRRYKEKLLQMAEFYGE